MKQLLFLFLVFSIPSVFAQNKELIDSIIESQEIDIYDDPLVIAEYPGGTEAMRLFIAKNFIYPPDALENEIQGKVYVQFVVSKEGNVTNVKIVRGIYPSCDAEALRIVKSMPKWKPATIEGKAVNSYYNLPVTFKLN